MLQVAAGVVDRLHHPNLAERLPMREAREHLCALVKRSADSLVASGRAAYDRRVCWRAAAGNVVVDCLRSCAACLAAALQAPG
jgi:hypothetical protein|eukprot:SAG25_NODE_1440_length_3014_cov_9.919370_3_plen_83_part_00